MKPGYVKLLVLAGLLAAVALVAAACTGPEGPPGAPGDIAEITCGDCHDDTTLVLSKQMQSKQQGHMTGIGAAYAGGRTSCTGCHASEGFTARIEAGVAAADVEAAPDNPTPPNCRTCHNIHETYTSEDWALTTTAPVTITTTGSTYDRGDGNLCANCHQTRRGLADVGLDTGEDVTITSTHWGHHHGAEANMFLGEGGYGVADQVSIHYTLVENGCPTCHMVDDNHVLEPDLDACQPCHADLDTFDRNGLQTEMHELFDELAELLEARGLFHDGHPVADAVGSQDEVGALWNLNMVHEDDSFGIHNPGYTRALLEKGLELLQ